MEQSSDMITVYLEIGKKRTIASALDWPGWCRSARDEQAALQTLTDYWHRYAHILHRSKIEFQPLSHTSAFTVVERLAGNATTDYGVPGLAPTSDSNPIGDLELLRLQTLLKACWVALDDAVESARGKTLRTGPRGGGRTLDGIHEHVLGAEISYLSSLGGKVPLTDSHQPSKEETGQVIMETLVASAHGEIASLGPRGGKRWSARYFVRRLAWHILDHIWEIEDRTTPG
jgi:hypothetical protein